MKLATTTRDFKNYIDNYEEQIKNIYDAGFRYIDLDFGSADDRFWGDGWEQEAKDLKKFAENLGMKFVQAHTVGFGNPLIYDEKRALLIERTIRSIEVCGVLGIENIVAHSGTRDGIGKKEFFEENLAFYKELYPAMEKWNVNVLIENTCKVNQAGKYFFLDGAEMREFLELANHKNLHACWDVGHANLEGHQYRDIIDLGDRLKALHIHDNYQWDTHAIPFTGGVKYDEVMQALIDSGYSGYFTLESWCSLVYSHWRFERAYKDDDRLRFPPLFLKQDMEKLLFKTGKYILEAYDCFEE